MAILLACGFADLENGLAADSRADSRALLTLAGESEDTGGREALMLGCCNAKERSLAQFYRAQQPIVRFSTHYAPLLY